MSFRIHAIAKEVNKTSKEIIELLRARGYDIKSGSSRIDNITALSLIEEFGAAKKDSSEADSVEGQTDSVVEDEKKRVEKEEAEKAKEAEIKVDSEAVPAAQAAPPLPSGKAPSIPATSSPQAPSAPPISPSSASSEDAAAVVEDNLIIIPPSIMVRDFAGLIGLKPFQLISELMETGVFASMNQSIEEDVARKIAKLKGFELAIQHRGKREESSSLQKECDEAGWSPSTPWFQVLPRSTARVEALFPRRKFMASGDTGDLSKLAQCGPALAESDSSPRVLEAPSGRRPKGSSNKKDATKNVSEEDGYDEFIDLASTLWSELSRSAKSVCGRATWEKENNWLPVESYNSIALKKGRIDEAGLPWPYLVNFLNEKEPGPANELILTLVEDLGSKLEQVAKTPRRVLRRERRKVQLGQAQQLDSACLSWLIRKPGKTAIEKAGGAQKILAVVREESFDTLENRVLKDFLAKASSSCERFLRKYAEFENKERFEKVRKFSVQLKRIAKAPFLKTVKSLNSIPKANYVLQQDPTYSKVWDGYEKLSKREKLQDDLFSWRRIAFRDTVRFIAALALVDWDGFEGYERTTPFEQKLWIREYPEKGSFFSDFDCPISFLTKFGGLKIVSLILPESVSENQYKGFPLKKILSSYGCDLIFLVESPESKVFDILFVWCSLSASGEEISSQTEISSEANRLSRELSTMSDEYPAVRSASGVWCHNCQNASANIFETSKSFFFLPISNEMSQWRKKELFRFREILVNLLEKNA